MTRHALPLVLLAIVLVLAGCLDAKKYNDVAYDAKTDTFRVLRVYYHINASSKAEQEYLQNLWANRDHVIPGDLIAFLGENAFVRIDEKRFFTISLGEAGQKPMHPQNSPMDLSKIVNKPGKFFLTADKTAAYYHQFEIPGSQVDALLVWVNGELNGLIAGQVKSEKDRRANGGKVLPWATARKLVLDRIPNEKKSETAPDTNEAPPQGASPLSCCTAETLEMIAKAAADKTMGISRKGSAFTMTIPAAAEDRKQMSALRDAVLERLGQAAKEKPDEKEIAVALDVAKLLKWGDDAKTNQLSLTVDYVELRKAVANFHEFFNLDAKPAEERKASYAQTVEALRGANIPIDESIKLADIPEGFAKQTLAVDRPKTSADPGKGLFKTPGGEMPATGP